jgi:hypothetical protein
MMRLQIEEAREVHVATLQMFPAGKQTETGSHYVPLLLDIVQ